MINGVLVDFGHTLFETAGSIDFVERFAADRGQPLPPGRAALLLDAAFARSRTPEELAKGRDVSAAAHRRCWLELYVPLEQEVPGIATALYEFETSPAGWAPYPDTEPFLRALAERGIPVAVVSDVAFDIRAICRHHGLDHLVHAWFLSAEHGTVKADGTLFEMALDALGTDPQHALMVGDNPANDGTAVLRGITTLLLPLPRPGASRGLAAALALLA